MRLSISPFSHLAETPFAARANAVWLSVLWGALLACAVGALVYDVNRWLSD